MDLRTTFTPVCSPPRAATPPHPAGPCPRHPDPQHPEAAICVVDYLSSLFHEEKAKYNERELRRILALPTEEEQVKAFEELRTAVAASKQPRGSQATG